MLERGFCGVADIDHQAVRGAFGIASLDDVHHHGKLARALLQPAGQGDREHARYADTLIGAVSFRWMSLISS
jgi:hypothetical protein